MRGGVRVCVAMRARALSGVAHLQRIELGLDVLLEAVAQHRRQRHHDLAQLLVGQLEVRLRVRTGAAHGCVREVWRCGAGAQPSAPCGVAMRRGRSAFEAHPQKRL